jgi:hypothetical protein
LASDEASGGLPVLQPPQALPTAMRRKKKERRGGRKKKRKQPSLR